MSVDIFDKLPADRAPRLIITGYAQHGKDTVCGILNQQLGLTSISSSWFMCQLKIYEEMRETYGYASAEECYNDRHNHRQRWYESIKAFVKGDEAKLGRLIFNQYDIYNGIRNIDELIAIRAEGLADIVIWVDASLRKPPEPSTSMTISKLNADWILDNNGNKRALYDQMDNLTSKLRFNLQGSHAGL